MYVLIFKISSLLIWVKVIVNQRGKFFINIPKTKKLHK